jgi:hypothetical protein
MPRTRTTGKGKLWQDFDRYLEEQQTFGAAPSSVRTAPAAMEPAPVATAPTQPPQTRGKLWDDFDRYLEQHDMGEVQPAVTQQPPTPLPDTTFITDGIRKAATIGSRGNDKGAMVALRQARDAATQAGYRVDSARLAKLYDLTKYASSVADYMASYEGSGEATQGRFDAEELITNIKPQDRQAFLGILSELVSERVPQSEGVRKFQTRATRGIKMMEFNMASALAGIAGKDKQTTENEQFYRDILDVWFAADPAKGQNTLTKGLLSAAEAAPSFVVSSLGAGKGKVRALQQMAFWFGQIQPGAEREMLQEGVPLEVARTASIMSGLTSAAIEMFNPLQGKIPAKSTVREFTKQFLKQVGMEYTEELAQGLSERAHEFIARGISDGNPIDWEKEAAEYIQEAADTAITLPWLMAPGGAVGVTGTAVAQRRAAQLKELNELRAKGFVTKEDAKKLEMSDEEARSRATRKAALDARIAELQSEEDIPAMLPWEEEPDYVTEQGTTLTQKEPSRAETIPSTETEVREEQGRKDVRGTREKQVPEEPAGEVAPAPQVQIGVAEAGIAGKPATVKSRGKKQPETKVKPETTQRVQDAIASAPRAEGGRILLADVRDALPDMSREELDAELRRLASEEQVSLMSLDDPREITDRDRAAAFKTGSGNLRHILYTDIPQKTAATEATTEPTAEPDLEKAGITVKKTKKGFSVSGIPAEVEFPDDIKQKYGGRKSAKGRYFFKQDPTEGLGELSRTIAEEARLNAEAEAEGLVRTRIGTLSPEMAEGYERQRQELIEVARQQHEATSGGVRELLSQFVSPKNRGAFRRQLQSLVADDYDKLTKFDEMVDYVRNHPELGLPQNPTELFEKLAEESFTQEFDEQAAGEAADEQLEQEINEYLEQEADKFYVAEMEEEDDFALERGPQTEPQKMEFETREETQQALFSKSGKPGQKNLFADKGVPDELVQESAAEKAQREEAQERRRIGAKKKRPGKPITSKAIRDTFPGSVVTPATGGWNVEIGDSFFTVRVTDDMPSIDWDAAEKAIGRKITAKERASIEAAGSTSLEFPDGSKHDGLGLILLNESLADNAVLRHEAVHLARQAGILGKAEWDALVQAHARGATDENVQEERIAQAMEAVETETRLWTRIQSWIRRLLAKLGIMDYQARDIHQLLRSSGFWARAGTPKARSARYALRGRPDLANPATDEEARRQVDDVDEARNQRGLPERRADTDVQREAIERLERDYEGERNQLMQAGRAGEQLTDVDTVIAKTIVNREASEALQSGDPQRVADSMALIEAYRNTGSAQGRAFRQRFDPVETPAERMARAISESILEPPRKERERRNKARREGRHEEADKINDDWAKELEKLKERLKALGVDLDNLWEDGYSRRQAGEILATIEHAKAPVWDKLFEYWRNSILSLPTTQMANVIGNVGHASWHFTAERFTEALVNTLIKRPDSAQLGEFKYMLAGMLPGMSEGARNFLTTWQTETPTFEARIGREGQWRIEDPNTAIGGKRGRVVRWPQRLLLAVDDFSKTVFTRMEVGVNAYRIAKAEQMSGEALSQRMQELMMNEESAAWDSAYDSALELTFQQQGIPTLQAIKKSALSFRRDVPFVRYLLPFITTPANIFATGIKKSPLGAAGIPIKMYKNHKDGRHVLHGVPKNVAEQVLAWALVLALLGNDEEDPWITGAEPESTFDKRQVGYRTAPAMSILLNGKYYSYSRVEPFATAIGLTVDFVNALRSGDTERMVDVPLASLKGQIGSKTFLSGMADILQAVQQESTSQGLARWASNFATSWVPNIVRGAGREASDYYENRRVWGTRSEWFARLGKRTLQKTELSAIQEYPIYDVWGRPATRSQTGMGPATDWLYRITVPIRIQNKETFVADQVIINYNLRNPEDERFPLAPRPYYTDKGKTVYMTDGQYAELARLTGETARQSLEGIQFDIQKPRLEDVEWINKACAEARGEVRDLLKQKWAGKNVDIDSKKLGRKIRQSMTQNLVYDSVIDYQDRERHNEAVSKLTAMHETLGLNHVKAQEVLLEYYRRPVNGKPRSARGWASWATKSDALAQLYGVSAASAKRWRDSLY